ncbi:fluoride efflux transporter CrcB [Pseudarthrobacter sp. P1]|uniref:fluoride efflux transporter CrcB n=1 Tax=Pseudarthrobacter sp. P1 TaxID=3418418 RepID=UPI003CF3692A
MTFWVFAALAVAGGLGAVARFVVDGLIRARWKTAYPWATTVINVTGSALLGFLAALAAAKLVSGDLTAIAGTGFLGGYTTFSTASYETVRLLKARRYGASLASGLGMLVACVGAAALGLWLGSLI